MYRPVACLEHDYSSMFDSNAHQCGLLNLFTRARAVGQSYTDLLSFRETKREEYLIRISYFILRNTSVQVPNRRWTLRTFPIKPVNKKMGEQFGKGLAIITLSREATC